MSEYDRQALLIKSLSDPNNQMYKSLVAVFRQCQAADERSREASPYVGFPFSIEPAVQAALEEQFSVKIRVSASGKRMPLTDRVAGVICLLDAALYEHAGGTGRDVLVIDGDIMTAVACGIDGRIIERTYATPRLMAGYHLEDEALHRVVTRKGKKPNPRADLMHAELIAGGGEHYWPKVRSDGPCVDSIVVNHFKTPCGPTQLAYLALIRKAVVYGCLPFQLEMLTRTSGELRCFPGHFYIDKQLDSITLVPADDAALSISMPYSAWVEVVTNNSVTVDGVEFLCEKYNSVKGVLYYTLNSVDMAFHAPEKLRTHYFDKKKVGLVELKYPKIRYSEQGVPIGVERGSSFMLEDRFNKVYSRLTTSVNERVTPAEAFNALMDHNNTVVNTLDSTQLAHRMDVAEEEAISGALALRVNWARSDAKKTFNRLLEAVKVRYSVPEASLFRFAMIALLSWWNRPNVMDSVSEGALPVKDIVDWCGNDFTVTMNEADPWLEVVQDVGIKCPRAHVMYSWLPEPKKTRASDWYKAILARAKRHVNFELKDDASGMSDSSSHPKSSKPVYRGPSCSKIGAAPPLSSVSSVVCGEFDGEVRRSQSTLTDVKSKLRDKLIRDQGARAVLEATRKPIVRDQISSNSLPMIPVAEVDPISAIQSDLLMANGGEFESIGPSMGYRIAEMDVHKNTSGNVKINDSKRVIPKGRYMRLPKVNAGVEGRRVGSQMSLFGALCKRNIGVPSNRGAVDLDGMADVAVERMIQTCYRDDWQSIVEKHMESGMWDYNHADIDLFLGNIDEKKARSMLNEFFLEGEINLDRWLLMAKGDIKPSREPMSHAKVDHSQTIMYLRESCTNAAYSPMIRHLKECIDECLRPNVSINPQRSPAEHEIWYNSLESDRSSHVKTYSYGSDIRCYDRSLEWIASRLIMTFYKRHGLNQKTLEKWESMFGVKKATSMMFGLVLTMTLGGVSGVFDTIMRNAIVNWAAVIVSANIKRNDIVCLDIKGDDMDAEFARPVQVETTIEKMSLTFNLSAKFFTNNVRYCCKEFRVKVEGWWYHLPDPWPKVQSICKPLIVGNGEVDLEERHTSLVSDLRHYNNGTLVDKVAECAQIYYGLERPLYGMARGLAAMVKDAKKFYNFYKPIQFVS